MKDIGKNIRELREQAGLTQEALAEQLFVTRQTLSNYENGRTRPDIDMLEKIAGVLETDLNTLLYGLPTSEAQRREWKHLAWGLLLTALAAAFYLTVRHFDQAEVNYDLSVRYVTGLLCRPLFYLMLGWTLTQIWFTLTRPKPQTGSWQTPLRHTVLAVLVLYAALELPFLLYNLWWAAQFRQSGAMDPGFSLGIFNSLYSHMGLFALRHSAAFVLPGALLRLCGFPFRQGNSPVE